MTCQRTRSPPSSPRRCALSALRAVLDTQILLRGALARTRSLTARLYEAWRADQFVLLVSEAILAEVDALTARADVLRKLRATPREARDKFLECAVAGAADYIVSADTDLLSLREVQGIPIVDAPSFWQKLAEHREPS